MSTTSNAQSSKKIDKKIDAIAKEVSDACPVRLDEATIMLLAKNLGDNIICYYHKLEFKKSRVDSTVFCNSMNKILLNNAKTSEALKPLRKMESSLWYSYMDEDGEPVCLIKITPEMYNAD